MSYALIALDGTQPGRCFWAFGDDESLDAAGHSPSLKALPKQLLDQDKLVLILPGDTAATRRIRLPIRGDRALGDAVRLEFEDVLADPVDNYSFGYGPLDDEGHRLVTALPFSTLEAAMHECIKVGLDPDIIAVDHCVLAQPDQQTVVLYDADRVLASLPQGGLSGAAALFDDLISEMVPADDVLLAINGGADVDDTVLQLTDDRLRGSFHLAAITYREPPNLRRGVFAKQRNWLALGRRWRGAAVLMAACLALWLANMVSYSFKYNQAADRLYEQSTEEFASAFPGVPIRDLRRQALQRQSATGGSSFLSLSSTLAGTMDGLNGVSLAGLRYTEQSELVADLRFPDAASLERLKTGLEGRGVIVREGGNLRREDNGDYAGQLYLGAAR